MDIDNPYYNYIISFTVPDIDNVTVVDYDALEHRIYWSDVRTQTIKRAFINGTGVETVVSAGRQTFAVGLRRCVVSRRCYCSLFVLHCFGLRSAKCPRPGGGLGVQEPVLDQLRRQ